MNCSVGRMKCSFSGNVSVLPLAIRPALGPGANSSPSLLSGSRPSPSGQEDAAAATACPPHPSSSPPDHLLGERYSLLHLKLLQHFKDQLGTTMCVSQPAVEPMVQKAVGEAFTTPFLMDELLAFSAIHKSTLQDAENRDYYRAEATRLQTRALSQFNAAQASLSDDNCLAVFLFQLSWASTSSSTRSRRTATWQRSWTGWSSASASTAESPPSLAARGLHSSPTCLS